MSVQQLSRCYCFPCQVNLRAELWLFRTGEKVQTRGSRSDRGATRPPCMDAQVEACLKWFGGARGSRCLEERSQCQRDSRRTSFVTKTEICRQTALAGSRRARQDKAVESREASTTGSRNPMPISGSLPFDPAFLLLTRLCHRDRGAVILRIGEPFTVEIRNVQVFKPA